MITEEQRQMVLRAAGQVASEGYFERARGGDQRAASLFARLVAFRLNPGGVVSGAGWLRKGGGHNVDGYAEDAIVIGNDPADRQNVIDLVRGAGAANAGVIAEPKERREVDTWEKPKALLPAELEYLRGGVTPGPNPAPVPQFPARNETLAAVLAFDADYKRRGRLNRSVSDEALHMDNEGLIVWTQQYLLYRVQGQAHQAAVDQVLRDIEAAWPK